MSKKILLGIICVLSLFVSGCSLSKKELIEDNTQMLEEYQKLVETYETYNGIDDIFEFYNDLSVNSVNSFVLIESRHTFTSSTTYCDGVIVASNGYDYYIMTDYNKLWVSNNIRYRIMNAAAEVYDANLLGYGNQPVYDSETGMVLLRVSVRNASTKMTPVKLGNMGSIIGHISSEKQLNKVEVIENNEFDVYYYKYDSIEYEIYKKMLKTNGSLVNEKNQLCGLYLSQIGGYAGYELIKKVAYATYSLTL